MLNKEHNAYSYLRHSKKFPNVWCAGCGIGIVMGAIIRAVDRMEIDKNDIAMISGIGCTGRMPVYMDFNTMHTTHGRALAFATGLKLAKPDMKILVVMGDGDAVAIGGNHFIHAARRNIDLTAIVVNNEIYGMTGGQYSPTTPMYSRSTTAPYGNIEPPMPISELAMAAGASFVARGSVHNALELDHLIEAAIAKRGFSLVEAMSYCHTTFGRFNKLGSAVDMMLQLKQNSLTVAAAAKLQPEEYADKFVRGILREVEKPEYTDLYEQLIERVQQPATSNQDTAAKEVSYGPKSFKRPHRNPVGG
jgi:2-oxoglutarate ferredoxin oxidoreductase subunit beta